MRWHTGSRNKIERNGWNGQVQLDIPTSRTLELLTEPLAVEWHWLLHHEVSAIHSNLTMRAIVAHEPILPFDLDAQGEQG